MNCAECKELMVGHIEGLLAEPQERSILSHLAGCPSCRAEMTELIGLHDRLVANGKMLAESDLENRVLNRIIRKQSLKLRKTNKFDRQFQLWRIIMKSKITKLATAAAIIVIAALSITFWEESATTAYAIEQTIEANHSVRYIHIKDFKDGKDEPSEFWVEFDEIGQVKNVRWHMPKWNSPDDGAKIGVWKENIAKVWLKEKNVLATVRDKTLAARMLELVEEHDPRLAVERLYEQESQGKVKIEIDEPADRAEPIVVTATSVKQDDSPLQRMVLFVDQATKLVTATEFYQLREGKYQYLGLQEYYDYNQPIEAKMFTLDEVPDDALQLDQVTREIGLVQGELSDKEIAVKVVRQFFEALIAKNYAEAGRLYQGITAASIREAYGGGSFIRIVSIGEPRPEPKYGKLRVPCTVEIEKDGEISQWQPHPEGLLVGPVNNEPERWTIFGGI